MRILKFGGTSVDGASGLLRVVGITRRSTQEERSVVVVSAFAGVTDSLARMVSQAVSGDGSWRVDLDGMAARHFTCLGAFSGDALMDRTDARLQAVFEETATLLRASELLRSCSPLTRDRVAGAGERLSALLAASALRSAGVDCEALDATDLLCTDSSFGDAEADLEKTRTRAVARLRELPGESVPVITGFIGADARGRTTTLGRGGSDYSASVLGAVLGASRVEIYTDVDGVMSAPPRIVAEAVSLPALHYREAAELAHFGAKVLQRKTILPAESAHIPIVVRNTFRPDGPHTVISSEAPPAATGIRGLAAVDGLALIESTEKGRDRGAARFWSAGWPPRRSGAVALMSGSADGSLVSLVPERHVELKRWYRRSAEAVPQRDELAVIAAVGRGAARLPRETSRLLDVLESAGIPVRAVMSGVSPDVITAVVAADRVPLALAALHRELIERPLLVTERAAPASVWSHRIGAAVDQKGEAS